MKKKIIKRTLIKETPKKIGAEVKLKGYVGQQRDHGKVIFIDLKDRSGTIQAVVVKDNKTAFDLAKKAKLQTSLEVRGKIKERPQKLTNKKITTGEIEIEVSKIKILSLAEELPIDISQKSLNLNLETLLEKRNLVLRNEKIKSIFKVAGCVLAGYRQAMIADDFWEIKTPKILSAVTEGGANFFKVDYFDQEAFLAQSPQFYKQMGVGIFERVFEVGPVFRAEPHFTSRHINEYTSLDAEMGFIDDFEEIMDQLELVMGKIMEKIKTDGAEALEKHQAKVPSVKKIPRIKLSEAHKILKDKFNKQIEDTDIDPEGERLICQYAQEKYNSDFIFLTHYPKVFRPMYTMPSEENPEETNSFDLLFRGVEIATGGQRIHHYQQLVASIKEHGFDPANFKNYLEIFKYGMPPHGGWGMGSERITQKVLGLKSVKEATLYPRDVKRLNP